MLLTCTDRVLGLQGAFTTICHAPNTHSSQCSCAINVSIIKTKLCFADDAGQMQHIICDKTYATHLILANADSNLGWNVSYTSFAHPASASASVGQLPSLLLLLMLVHVCDMCHSSHAWFDGTHSLREILSRQHQRDTVHDILSSEQHAYCWQCIAKLCEPPCIL